MRKGHESPLRQGFRHCELHFHHAVLGRDEVREKERRLVQVFARAYLTQVWSPCRPRLLRGGPGLHAETLLGPIIVFCNTCRGREHMHAREIAISEEPLLHGDTAPRGNSLMPVSASSRISVSK